MATLAAIEREPMTRLATWVAIASMTCGPALAFEVDSFRSGMSFAEAKSLVEKQAYERVELKDNQIRAWDTRSVASGIFLDFCKGRLVSVQKNLQPRFDYFTRLVDEKRSALGRPLDAWSRPTDVTSSVESNAIALIWRDGSDFVSVTYTEFSSNKQLYITHDARNDCWRIPY